MPGYYLTNALLSLDKEYQARNIRLTNVELYKEYAKREGLADWKDLFRYAPPSRTARIFGARHQDVFENGVLSVEELAANPLQPYQFYLGVEPTPYIPPNVPRTKQRIRPEFTYDTFARRHILLVGPHGNGWRTTLESLVIQQVLQGGGLLLLDTLSDPQVPGLATAAECAGRNDFVEITVGEELRNLCTDTLVGRQRVVHVKVPFGNDDTVHKDMRQLVERLAVSAYALREQTRREKAYFMLAIPMVNTLWTPEWRKLLDDARMLGIILVFHLQTFVQLDGLPLDFVDSLLNFDTKIVFNPRSPESLVRAAEYLDPADDHSKPSKMKTQLSQLGLGDAILLVGSSDLKTIHTPMVTETLPASKRA